MPYCHNCGHALPDNAKFCTECGTAVAAPTAAPIAEPTSAPAQPNGYFTPTAKAPQPKANKSRTGLIVALAVTAGVLLLALIALLATQFVNLAKAEETIAPPSAVEKVLSDDEPSEAESTKTMPTVTAQGIEVAEIATLLDAYAGLTDAIIHATSSDFAAQYNGGSLYDLDSDGYPELVLLYSLDGEELDAAIVRRTDDSSEPVVLKEKLWDFMAGGAGGAIYSGTLDTGEPVIFLEASTWEGETSVAKSYVYSLADTDIELVYRLEYFFDLEGDLVNCWVFDADDELLSRDNVEQFLNIYNAREYIEAEFPSEEYGVALADLFSEEAMEAYFSLE